jgi:hypothetical protein
MHSIDGEKEIAYGKAGGGDDAFEIPHGLVLFARQEGEGGLDMN